MVPAAAVPAAAVPAAAVPAAAAQQQQWEWLGDGDVWVAYPADVCALLDDAVTNKLKKVVISTTHLVTLTKKEYWQCRRDDVTRRRQVCSLSRCFFFLLSSLSPSFTLPSTGALCPCQCGCGRCPCRRRPPASRRQPGHCCAAVLRHAATLSVIFFVGAAAVQLNGWVAVGPHCADDQTVHAVSRHVGALTVNDGHARD